VVDTVKKTLKWISLFASGWIWDLAVRSSGIHVITANELLKDRCSVFKRNFPETEMFCWDIWELKTQIINDARSKLKWEPLDFMIATPPCQWMSKNWQWKLLKGIREGTKPAIDPRNRLIIPTIDIAVELQPETLVLENVPEMFNTIIDDENGDFVNIIEYIKKRLWNSYTWKAEVVEFAEYWVPQKRQRLITIFTKKKGLIKYFKQNWTFLPPKTHSEFGWVNLKPYISLYDTIWHLPELDWKNIETAKSNIPYHYVPVLDEKKYFWIQNTPPEKGAFDNQCVNPLCLYKWNQTHSSWKTDSWINQSNKETPVYCEKCWSLLPRPSVQNSDWTHRIMSWFTSAYKRMSWKKPSPTLTTNLSFPSSDNKLHPTQNRVLSLYEAFQLHTICDYEYKWETESGKDLSDAPIREIIGESIPPRWLEIIFKHLIENKSDLT
jgi:DNA (cytosine-5)-methyltransferase 1